MQEFLEETDKIVWQPYDKELQETNFMRKPRIIYAKIQGLGFYDISREIIYLHSDLKLPRNRDLRDNVLKHELKHAKMGKNLLKQLWVELTDTSHTPTLASFPRKNIAQLLFPITYNPTLRRWYINIFVSVIYLILFAEILWLVLK